jgi:hypothetical protein
LGDEGKGSRIPVSGSGAEREYLSTQTGEVWTRLEARTLRWMALATPGGRYLHGATGTFDLGALYRGLIAGEEGRDFGPVEVTRYQEKFQIFLLAALLLLAAGSLLSERPRQTGRQTRRQAARGAAPKAGRPRERSVA